MLSINSLRSYNNHSHLFSVIRVSVQLINFSKTIHQLGVHSHDIVLMGTHLFFPEISKNVIPLKCISKYHH